MDFSALINIPTSDECCLKQLVFENDIVEGYACWYPQMGGYVAKAIAIFDKDSNEDGCVDVLIWHNGEFPFGNDEQPRRLHHCLGEQFITFGKFLKSRGRVPIKEKYDLK